MTNLVALKKPPSDLAYRLREMADSAAAGTLTEMVVCYVEYDQYSMLIGASKMNSIAMASMLWQKTVDDMKA